MLTKTRGAYIIRPPGFISDWGRRCPGSSPIIGKHIELDASIQARQRGLLHELRESFVILPVKITTAAQFRGHRDCDGGRSRRSRCRRIPEKHPASLWGERPLPQGREYIPEPAPALATKLPYFHPAFAAMSRDRRVCDHCAPPAWPGLDDLNQILLPGCATQHCNYRAAALYCSAETLGQKSGAEVSLGGHRGNRAAVSWSNDCNGGQINRTPTVNWDNQTMALLE